MSKDFILKTTPGYSLRVSIYGYENLGKRPCVIFVHGFKGFKDWGFGPYMGEFFAKDITVLSFNFSHNGVGENLNEFLELDKFAQNTFSLEINELSELIDAYLNGYFGEISNKKIALLGHSRGGAVSLLTAFQKKEVNAVAVWASVSYLDRYSDRQKEKWRREGVFEVLNTRTKQVMRLNTTLLDDIEINKNGLLSIENSVRNLNRPFLIAHGEQDLAVPIKEAEQLYNWSDKSLTEFYKIPTAGHTFDIQHPFTGTNSKFDTLLNKTNTFFKTNLF